MENILPPANPRANLQDYREACDSFRWEDVKSEFSWSHTGRINIAHEAIDRHAEDPVRGQTCCLTFETEGRREKITYHRMRRAVQ